LRITLSNVSPCQTLTVQLNLTGDPVFFVTADNPTTMPPTSTSISASIPANSSHRFVVTFGSSSDTAFNGHLTITHNDPNRSPMDIPLTGLGVLETPIELVLDHSGSMAGAAASGTKLQGLKSAVHLFTDLIVPGRGDQMGSVKFDDRVVILMPFGTFDAAKQSDIKTDANLLTADGMTSIGGGMQLGHVELEAAVNPVVIMLVLTDGLENTPPNVAGSNYRRHRDICRRSGTATKHLHGYTKFCCIFVGCAFLSIL
jgi:hypothetical protein